MRFYNISFFIFFLFSLFHSKTSSIPITECKEWTFMIYMAADNDLAFFAKRNIKQMLETKVDSKINIIICYFHFDTKQHKKIVCYMLIKNGKTTILQEYDSPEKTDSGDENNLIHFCLYTQSFFPAAHYALIFWNHGTGPIDPFTAKQPLLYFNNPLFHESQKTQTSFFSNSSFAYKGICFDDTCDNYLTEHKIRRALFSITQQLPCKKYSLIGFDTCLMATIEIANLVAPFATHMVASQELELGTGWNYKKIFSLFEQDKQQHPATVAQHIVETFSDIYKHENDFTLSALNLTFNPIIEEQFKKIVTYLYDLLSQKATEESIYFIIKKSKDLECCTHFDESDYIDLFHFCKNILKNIKKECDDTPKQYQQHLIALLQQLIDFSQQWIICNKTGNYHCNAHGVSLYFPEDSIHHSYKSNSFANNSMWLLFLKKYIVTLY